MPKFAKLPKKANSNSTISNWIAKSAETAKKTIDPSAHLSLEPEITETECAATHSQYEYDRSNCTINNIIIYNHLIIH